MPATVICHYRVRSGQEQAFEALLERHWPALRRLGLATDEPSRVYRGADAAGRPLFWEIFDWKSEDAAGRPLWRGIMESLANNPEDAPEKDTANTYVVFHRGRLLAVWYRCGVPYAVDARTLEPLGPVRERTSRPRIPVPHATSSTR